MLFILAQNRSAPFRRNIRNAEGVPIAALEFAPRVPTNVEPADIAIIQKDIAAGVLLPCTVNSFGKAILDEELAAKIAAADPKDLAAIVAEAASVSPTQGASATEGDTDEVPPSPKIDEAPTGDNSSAAPNSDAESKKSKKSKK